jgi:hypothetical protein
MLIDKLIDIKENIQFQISGIKNVDDLIEALNDWPQSPLNLEEYEKQLREFLKDDTLSLSLIQTARKKINSKIHPWESESLASLYRFMYMNSAKEIEDLFLKMKEYF